MFGEFTSNAPLRYLSIKCMGYILLHVYAGSLNQINIIIYFSQKRKVATLGI